MKQLKIIGCMLIACTVVGVCFGGKKFKKPKREYWSYHEMKKQKQDEQQKLEKQVTADLKKDQRVINEWQEYHTTSLSIQNNYRDYLKTSVFAAVGAFSYVYRVILTYPKVLRFTSTYFPNKKNDFRRGILITHKIAGNKGKDCIRLKNTQAMNGYPFLYAQGGNLLLFVHRNDVDKTDTIYWYSIFPLQLMGILKKCSWNPENAERTEVLGVAINSSLDTIYIVTRHESDEEITTELTMLLSQKIVFVPDTVNCVACDMFFNYIQ